MIYAIADIEILVIPEEVDFLGQRFAGFLSERKDPSSALHLKVSRRTEPFARGHFPPNPVHIRFENQKIVIERGDFRGRLDLGSFEAEVEVSSGTRFSPEVSLESFIRIAYSLILPDRDGFTIHASSLVRDGKAYVFPGKPGAGKTTIVRLSPDATLLTDEISIIRGIGKSPRAHGTPFHGDLGVPGENISAPIQGLYFPVQDKKNYLERLETKAALERLLPNIVFFAQDQTLIRRIFHLSYELVAALPCYNLHFLPEPSFWDCIDARQLSPP